MRYDAPITVLIPQCGTVGVNSTNTLFASFETLHWGTETTISSSNVMCLCSGSVMNLTKSEESRPSQIHSNRSRGVPTEDFILVYTFVHGTIIVELMPARPFFVEIPEVNRGSSTSFPGSFEDGGIRIVDFVHDSVADRRLVRHEHKSPRWRSMATSYSYSTIRSENP